MADENKVIDFKGFNPKNEKMLALIKERTAKVDGLEKELKKTRDETELKIELLQNQRSKMRDIGYEKRSEIFREYGYELKEWDTAKDHYEKYTKLVKIANNDGVKENFLYDRSAGDIFFYDGKKRISLDIKSYNDKIKDCEIDRIYLKNPNSSLKPLNTGYRYHRDEKTDWNKAIKKMSRFSDLLTDEYIIKKGVENATSRYPNATIIDKTLLTQYSDSYFIIALKAPMYGEPNKFTYIIKKYKISMNVHKEEIEFYSTEYKEFIGVKAARNRYNDWSGKEISQEVFKPVRVKSHKRRLK